MASGSDLQFVSTYKLCPQDSELCILVEQIDSCNSDASYKSLIDDVVKRYVEEPSAVEKSYIRNIVINCFTKTTARKNIKKYMYEKFNRTVIRENVFLFEDIMINLITEIQTNINNLNSFNIGQCFNILCYLGCYIQCLSKQPDFVELLVKALPLYLCILEVFTSQLQNVNFTRDEVRGKGILEYSDCYTVLEICLGQLSSTLPRAQFVVGIKCYAVRMVILCHEVLVKHSELKFETISKAAVVVSYFSLHLPAEEKELLKYKSFPVMDFLDNPENNYCMALKIKRLKNVYDTDLMKLVLTLSIYTSVATPQLLSLQYQGKPILVTLYDNLYNFGMQMSAYPERMQPISGTLMALSKYIPKLENYTELYQKALTFAWANLEYSLDTVVKNTKKLVCFIVNEAGKRHIRGDDEQLDMFFKCLETRTLYTKVHLNALLAASTVLHCDIIINKCKSVQTHMLTLMTTTTDHELACQIYTNMMNVYLRFESDERIISTWLRPVLLVLRRPTIKHHYLLEGIVTHAFQTKPSIFRKLFNPKTVGIVRECVIMLKCIHYARLHGIELPSEEEIKPQDYWRDFLVKGRLELFMVHQNDEIRLTTLQVIAECQRSTEEFTQWEFEYLLRYFQMNVALQSPASRNRICSYYKKILLRYHSTHQSILRKMTTSRNALQKPAKDDQQKAERKETQETLEACKAVARYYEDFFNHLMRLLVFYLSPDANHSRRSTCLELLIFVHSLNCRNEWLKIFQEDEVSCLKHILHDNYESNKAMAVQLLRTLPPETIGFDSEENTRSYYDLAIHMACDIRPSQSVSASYMFQVVLMSEYPFKTYDKSHLAVATNKTPLMLLAMVQKLESMYKESNQDVVQASKSTPFYGLLMSCRNILRHRDMRDDNPSYSFIFHQLANLCLRMKDHIMPVVCNTSPEGHLPETSDESDDSFLESEQACRSQKVLVYSWKTMKEIMLLLAELANQTVTLENVMEMLSEDYLMKIGEFFLDVFVRTKHRGVFEQAHTAFITICRSFLHSKSIALNKLPKIWLNYGVALCTGTTVDERLCPTRRSAGLPFLILSILPTLSELHREYVRRTVDPLLLKAREDNEEQKIHCLNVLRFIFKNSKLTENLKRFVDRGTIAALEGFRSRTWGVRNAATLLLSTLITKIFGVPNKSSDSDQEETRLTTGTFALTHKLLFEFLLSTLEQECENTHSLILHPVLLILSRLYPSFNQNINEQVQRYIRCINVCIRNPSYRTRDLAARASVSLISQHFLAQQLTANFNRISLKYIRDTECHGLLLQIVHILNTTSIDKLTLADYLKKSKHLLSEAGVHYSHMTVALYMDVVFIMLSRYRESHDMAVLKDVILLLDQQPINIPLTTSRTSFTYNRFQLFMCILVTKFEHVSETYSVLNQMILTCLYSKDYEMKKKVLQLLIYLNQEFSEDQFREHPLFISGDIEICPQIKALVHSFDFKCKKELLTYTHPYLLKYFFAEINAQLKLERDYCVLVFLLMRFYPCFFKSLYAETKQIILNFFMFMARRRNEEQSSAVISAMKVFLMTLTPEELQTLNYVDMITLLRESAAPSAADFRRLTVAQFIVGAQALFKNKIFNEFDRYNVFNLVMILLEDDEAIVRNTMSQFPTKKSRILPAKSIWQVIPTKARNTLALSTSSDFKSGVAIGCLTSWALRRLPEVTRDTSAVYERSELNTFAENIPVSHAMSRALHNVLWNMCGTLSYKDRSIFVEELTLVITNSVLNSLVMVPSPMMDKATKRTVICVLKTMVKFLEECPIGGDFQNNFKTFFNTTILRFLRNSLDIDYSSAKAFFTYLYNPILIVHGQFP